MTAYEIVNMQKKDNAVSMYEHMISTASSLGLDAGYVREFMDYQTLSDFILTNSDRHLYNFGVLRDPETMKPASMAPIYDSGNSMFYRDPFAAVKRESILSMRIAAMGDREEKMLKMVSDPKRLNIDLLPGPQDIFDLYAENGIDELKAKLISTGYGLKLDMLQEFQHGITVSLYHEKTGCAAERPGLKSSED